MENAPRGGAASFLLLWIWQSSLIQTGPGREGMTRHRYLLSKQ